MPTNEDRGVGNTQKTIISKTGLEPVVVQYSKLQQEICLNTTISHRNF